MILRYLTRHEMRTSLIVDLNTVIATFAPQLPAPSAWFHWRGTERNVRSAVCAYEITYSSYSVVKIVYARAVISLGVSFATSIDVGNASALLFFFTLLSST